MKKFIPILLLSLVPYYSAYSKITIDQATNVASNKISGEWDKVLSVVDQNVTTPLAAFHYGIGFELNQMKKTPYSIKATFGLGNAKVHSVGFDYQMTQYLKTGVSLIYGHAIQTISIASPSIQLKNKETMPAMTIDVYLMAPKMSIISPYVGASVGYAKHNFSSTVAGGVYDSATPYKTQYNSLIYSLSAGLIADISSSTSVDLMYKRNDFGFKGDKLDRNGFHLSSSGASNYLGLTLRVKL